MVSGGAPPHDESVTEAAAYRAIATPNRKGWAVHIDGLESAADFHAPDLSEIDQRASTMLQERIGDDGPAPSVAVDVRLTPSVQHRLDLIEALCDDIDQELEAAYSEMRDLGLSVLDIAYVLRTHYRLSRPLTITNRDLAEQGLEAHPDVVAVQWDDHGHFETIRCRADVDAARGSYAELPPDGQNVLIYAGTKFECDFCDGAAT